MAQTISGIGALIFCKALLASKIIPASLFIASVEFFIWNEYACDPGL